MYPSREVANLLGVWIEMICQYAIWPILKKYSAWQIKEIRNPDG